jgi:hypothetical protein
MAKDNGEDCNSNSNSNNLSTPSSSTSSGAKRAAFKSKPYDANNVSTTTEFPTSTPASLKLRLAADAPRPNEIGCVAASLRALGPFSCRGRGCGAWRRVSRAFLATARHESEREREAVRVRRRHEVCIAPAL